MPTATATLSWTLTNWGPLTTSWSLPDSCTSNVALAYTEEPGWIIINEQCSPSPFSCLPSPTDSNAPAALSSARNTIGLDIHPDPFYSPAPSCPDGWKTVGVAAREGTATASKSGWFTASFEDNLEEIDFADDSPIELNEAIALLLDAGETAVACCPSSMTMLPGYICSSSLPSYKVSTACESYWEATGALTDEHTIGTGTDTWTVSRTTYSSDEASQFTGWSQVRPLMLLHKPTDLAGNEEDDSETKDEADAADAAEETNAAAGGYGGEAFWGVGSRVFVSAVGSMLAGAALVMLR
ncbi:hypothetical protein BDW71DRAFT_171807 [Aspergillus fruticulosus]